MADYVTTLQRTASTTASLGVLGCGATPRRLFVYEMTFGSEATAADNPFLWVIQRFSAAGNGAGTSTAVTPQTRDPADSVAANGVAGQNSTIEPNYVANQYMLRLPLNQRATFRWVAQPGKELVTAATQTTGFGWATPTATAVAITSTIVHSE